MKTIPKGEFLKRGFVAWLLIMIAGTLIDQVRDAVMVPAYGAPSAMFVASLAFIAVVYFGAWALVRNAGRPESRMALLYTGLVWAALTFAFEALLVMGFADHSLETFLALYRPEAVKDGVIQLYVLLAMIFAPFGMARYAGGR